MDTSNKNNVNKVKQNHLKQDEKCETNLTDSTQMIESNYDSHSEKKPHQEEIVTDYEQDRGSYTNANEQLIDNGLEESKNLNCDVDADESKNNDDKYKLEKNKLNKNVSAKSSDNLPTSI